MGLLKTNPALHEAGFESKVRQTYKGQAHFAGSGPEGASCRRCAFWKSDASKFDRKKSPRAYCTYRLPGKAHVQIPGSALACKFYERTD